MELPKILKRLDAWKRILFIVLLILIFLAIMDILAIPLWNAEPSHPFFKFFWRFSLGTVLLIVFTYFLITKDISESLAILFIYEIFKWTGVEDLIFYLIKDQSIPQAMDHLFKHEVMGNIAQIMGQTTVTPISLIVSVGIGIMISYFVLRRMVRI